MKKFTVPCNFNGTMSPFAIYVGFPKDGMHPIQNQADWLSKERGGAVPPEVMDSLSKLKALADKNNVSFEELCVYALGAAQQTEEPATGEENEPLGEVPEEKDEGTK